MKVKQGIRWHEKHVYFSHTQQGVGRCNTESALKMQHVYVCIMASCNFNVAPKLFFSAQNRKNRKKTSKTEPKPDESF